MSYGSFILSSENLEHNEIDATEKKHNKQWNGNGWFESDMKLKRKKREKKSIWIALNENDV